jgi:hypothetical protein
MGQATWRVIGTSVRGASHDKTGQPCQDAHHWELLPDGWLVAAVADGAGSAPWGDVGAALAARTAVERLRVAVGEHAGGWREVFGPAGPWESLLTDAVEGARAAVEAEAASRQAQPRDMASTLLLVAATPNVVAAAQVGDGAVVIQDASGELRALTAPARGEYFNETVFLTSPDARERLQRQVWRGAAAHVAMFSDGLQMLALKMPAATPHAPFFAPLFRFAAEKGGLPSGNEELAAFLGSDTIRRRTDDDVTLLLAARVDDGAE